MEVAHYKLLTGKIEECKADIEECEKIQEKLLSTDPIINASFYRVSADYYKARFGKFTSLLLGHCWVSTILP
jgi:26S proteasome regulatory subunit N9